MRIVQRVETFDGVIHCDYQAALRHLSIMHADRLGEISRALCDLDAKYVATGDWVNENLGRFMDLNTIKQDMKVCAPEGEED